MSFHMKKAKSSKLIAPAGDLDNYVKLVLDSMNGLLYNDDKQIVRLSATKQFCNSEYIIIEWSEEECTI